MYAAFYLKRFCVRNMPRSVRGEVAKACYRLVGQRSDRFGFENICDDLSSIFAAGEPVGFLPVKR